MGKIKIEPILKCGINFLYPFPEFNGAAAEIWEELRNFIQQLFLRSMLNLKSIHVNKRGLRQQLVWCLDLYLIAPNGKHRSEVFVLTPKAIYNI